jgi:hypothetical protein
MRLSTYLSFKNLLIYVSTSYTNIINNRFFKFFLNFYLRKKMQSRREILLDDINLELRQLIQQLTAKRPADYFPREVIYGISLTDDERIKRQEELTKVLDKLEASVDKPPEEFMKEVRVFYKLYRETFGSASMGGVGNVFKKGLFDRLIQESQNEETIEKLQNIIRLNVEKNKVIPNIKDNNSGSDIQGILMIVGMVFLGCIFYKIIKKHCQRRSTWAGRERRERGRERSGSNSSDELIIQAMERYNLR